MNLAAGGDPVGEINKRISGRGKIPAGLTSVSIASGNRVSGLLQRVTRR